MGTPIPVQSLIEHLEADDSINNRVESFPYVKREAIIAVLESFREQFLVAL